jgi:hypothetical protein
MVHAQVGHQAGGIEVRVHATVANGIAQMWWEALPEHRRDVVDFNEAGSSPWISSHISGSVIVFLP